MAAGGRFFAFSELPNPLDIEGKDHPHPYHHQSPSDPHLVTPAPHPANAAAVGHTALPANNNCAEVLERGGDSHWNPTQLHGFKKSPEAVQAAPIGP